jgi:hypothetical protein
MTDNEALVSIHPEGESGKGSFEASGVVGSLDTFAGKVHVRWAPEAAVSSHGLLPYFIEFLKVSGRFDAWVADCPLVYTSRNAPQKRDLLGTILLSVLAGHWRYAHISAIRGDGVNPGLLGMTKVASEDSVRRAMKALDEERSGPWLKQHLKASYEPLLEEPWALDMDTTVKVLYGHQEDARVGYNPTKPGRPSHAIHSYFMANVRMVVDVEVQAGNQTASSFAQPELWVLLDDLKQNGRAPSFLRGDCGWGTDRAMSGAEQRGIPYLFKLKQTARVQKLILRLFGRDEWVAAGQGWQGLDTELQLSGWDRKRRVVVLRRPLPEPDEAAKPSRRRAGRRNQAKSAGQQMTLGLPEAIYGGERYEYAVLVTSLDDEVLTLAQHYRDRGDAENNFDELKNQWGWAGFTTQDSRRCEVMARITALIYNWWTIFMRLGIPDKHAEAITSRPLAMNGIARQTTHANQTTIEITSTHAKAPIMVEALINVSAFLKRISGSAEQFVQPRRWSLILSAAFRFFLKGRVLGQTFRLAPATG